MHSREKILAMVLAGGEGSRLLPLTRERAKPAVPFGGLYRLVDFALSNLVNSGLRRIVVLTQYRSHSLDLHMEKTWRLSPLLGNYVVTVPAQMRTGRHWFAGSADAVYQNLNIIDDEQPKYVAVFGADHIYRMDVEPMLLQHIESGAGVTVAGIPVPIEEAGSFGIIEATEDGRMRSFVEKPESPMPIPGDPTRAFASMGNYVFNTEILREVVTADAAEDTKHDMGANIIPTLVDSGDAWVYDFGKNQVPGQVERERGYWRDVGTIDAYFQASMDLVAAQPVFDLYNYEWPIFTWQYPHPPAKCVHEEGERRGRALASLVAGGVVVSGGTARRSILGPRVRLNSFSEVEDCVLFDNVEVGRHAVVHRAVIDKNVRIPENYEIGIDYKEDLERGFTISDDGIVVIAKGTVLD